MISRRVLIILAVFVGLSLMFFLMFLNNNNPQTIYPAQQTYWKYSKLSTTYSIAIISDMDKSSRVQINGTLQELWTSKFIRGTLQRKQDGTYSIEWTTESKINSRFNEAGRGMELSELSFFNNRLYSVDDRTGIIFDLSSGLAVPIHIFMDGDGVRDKGFKGEWSTVKDGKLYIGSIGKEWMQDGIVKNVDPMWVKTIDQNGVLEHVNWKPIYDKLRIATSTVLPGYLLHEAVNWNPIERKWYFLPRRVSHEDYDEVLDEERCGNIAIISDENFEHIEVEEIGELNKIRGFSSFKFIPMRENEIVALKTQEKDETVTFITVLDLATGKTLLPETKIGNVKFEGLEFL